MHDVLGQQLSVIVAQAATTRRVSADRPEATADALGSIESVGRDALSALRRELGLLRVDRERDDPGSATWLDRLDEMVDRVRRAGLPVELVVRGVPRSLPAEVELTAFRTVQEALTNSLRHSAHTPVTVTLAFDAAALDIDVADSDDDDSPPDVGRAGHEPPVNGHVIGYGLAGMRQRVEMLGGRVTAGVSGSGKFRVRARLPVAPQTERSAG
jgi:signal transduction histidine kinase